MQEIPIANKAVELDIAINAAILAGKTIMDTYNKDYNITIKKDDSPVTDADMKSNEKIKEILGNTYHILTEEDPENFARLNQDTIWIVDPLDGTADYIDKTGEFTVMIALVKDKKPILGVIGWPAKGIVFAAQKDKGAFKWYNNQWVRISTNNTANLSQCRAVLSRHHLTDKEKSFIKKLEIDNYSSIGSSLKAAKISSGEAELYLTTTDKLKEWDTAASYCIINEAGGKMTDMHGNDITYNNKIVFHKNGILISNGVIHEKIVKAFSQF